MTEADRLERIEQRLTTLEETDQRIEKVLENLVQQNENLIQQNREFNLRLETYQKASQQVVNLAFSLIVTAAAAIIIPALISSR